MAANKMPVCPHCGSKQVSRIESFYHCDKCENDFGREVLSDNGKPIAEEAVGLRFRIGDYLTGSIHLRIQEDEGSCLYEVYSSTNGGADKVADVLPMEDWKKLKETLINELYFNDWEKEYLPVNDGQGIRDDKPWEISLIVSEDESISYRGVGEHPVYWNALVKLVDPFFAKLDIENK